MKKVDKVFAVFLVYGKLTQLLFQRSDNEFWTLLGGTVEEMEDELDALLRHLHEEWLPSEVIIHAQLGPVHRLQDGTTAKAFLCTIDDPSGTPAGEMHGQYKECKFFSKKDVKESIAVDPAPVECAIWDGFSVMEEPQVLSKQEDFEDDSIYCDPGAEHLLVREGDDARYVWRRLDPSSSSGYMEPSS